MVAPLREYMENNKQKRVVIAVIVVASFVVLIVTIAVISTRMTRSSDGRVAKIDDAAAPAPSVSPVAGPTSQPASARKIKVGVYLSHYTANGPNWTGKGWGYNSQVRILREMKSPEIELYALIEPGSEKQPDLVAKLNAHFKTRPKLDVTDPRALRQVDVIVANAINNATDPALAALETVVGEGKGLLVRCVLGDFEPGFTPVVSRLHGLSDGAYAWNKDAVQAEIVGQHPILGRLSGKTGTTIMVRANGGFGALTPGSVPLIQLRNDQPVRATTDAPLEWPFYPLYTSALGKGRIVVCSIAGHADTPDELQAATDGRFVLRAIAWAAKREVK